MIVVWYLRYSCMTDGPKKIKTQQNNNEWWTKWRAFVLWESETVKREWNKKNVKCSHLACLFLRHFFSFSWHWKMRFCKTVVHSNFQITIVKFTTIYNLFVLFSLLSYRSMLIFLHLFFSRTYMVKMYIERCDKHELQKINAPSQTCQGGRNNIIFLSFFQNSQKTFEM